MNYTRQRWSNNFHCVKIHTDLVSVVALTVFFCFLPIIFYTSVKLQGASSDKKTGRRRFQDYVISKLCFIFNEPENCKL